MAIALLSPLEKISGCTNSKRSWRKNGEHFNFKSSPNPVEYSWFGLIGQERIICQSAKNIMNCMKQKCVSKIIKINGMAFMSFMRNPQVFAYGNGSQAVDLLCSMRSIHISG